MQKYDKLEAMKSLGTLWQLGETSWKLTAWAFVSFTQKTMYRAQMKSPLHCLCLKSVQSVNKCITHTAVGTVTGGWQSRDLNASPAQQEELTLEPRGFRRWMCCSTEIQYQRGEEY